MVRALRFPKSPTLFFNYNFLSFLSNIFELLLHFYNCIHHNIWCCTVPKIKYHNPLTFSIYILCFFWSIIYILYYIVLILVLTTEICPNGHPFYLRMERWGWRHLVYMAKDPCREDGMTVIIDSYFSSPFFFIDCSLC